MEKFLILSWKNYLYLSIQKKKKFFETKIYSHKCKTKKNSNENISCTFLKKLILIDTFQKLLFEDFSGISYNI